MQFESSQLQKGVLERAFENGNAKEQNFPGQVPEPRTYGAEATQQLPAEEPRGAGGRKGAWVRSRRRPQLKAKTMHGVSRKICLMSCQELWAKYGTCVK